MSGDGERCDVWAESMRKARKPHWCSTCTMAIQRGDFYVYISGVFDRSGFSEHSCLRCHQAAREFAARHDSLLYTGPTMREMFDTCLSDEPDSAQWIGEHYAIDASGTRPIIMFDEVLA